MSLNPGGNGVPGALCEFNKRHASSKSRTRTASCASCKEESEQLFILFPGHRLKSIKIENLKWKYRNWRPFPKANIWVRKCVSKLKIE